MMVVLGWQWHQLTTPTPHQSILQAESFSCRPTNSVKALKANKTTTLTSALKS